MKSISLSVLRLTVNIASMYTLQLLLYRECTIVDKSNFVSHWYTADWATRIRAASASQINSQEYASRLASLPHYLERMRLACPEQIGQLSSIAPVILVPGF
jgi:hypothetical protein